jgi:hypothetical protein
MELRGVDPSGMEDWYCQVCGRHFMMRWPPTYEKVVLVHGDQEAIHVGGKGGLHMGEVAVGAGDPSDQQAQPPYLEAPDHAAELLDPWRDVLGSFDDSI